MIFKVSLAMFINGCLSLFGDTSVTVQEQLISPASTVTTTSGTSSVSIPQGGELLLNVGGTLLDMKGPVFFTLVVSGSKISIRDDSDFQGMGSINITTPQGSPTVNFTDKWTTFSYGSGRNFIMGCGSGCLTYAGIDSSFTSFGRPSPPNSRATPMFNSNANSWPETTDRNTASDSTTNTATGTGTTGNTGSVATGPSSGGSVPGATAGQISPTSSSVTVKVNYQ